MWSCVGVVDPGLVGEGLWFVAYGFVVDAIKGRS
jgi:hypothetical protein